MKLAVTNAVVHPVTDDVIENGTVLIEDGKIAAVGENVDIPSDVKVIDAQGAPVTPGLVEPHGHVGLINSGLAMDADVNESTDPVTAKVKALDGINPLDEGFKDFLIGGITTVLVLPGSSNVLGGVGTTIKTRPVSVIDDAVIQQNSGMKAALGENPKRAHGQRQNRAPKTRMGSAAIMRKWLRRAKEYADKKEDNENNKYDAQLEALIPVVNKEVPLRIHAHRADDIANAIKIAEEFDLLYTIEHTTQGFKMPELLAEKGVSCAVGPCMSSESKVELEGVGYDTPVALEKAKANWCLTTDHPVVRGLYLHMVAGVASAHGVGDEGALKAVTLSSAQHIGVDERLGSLESGKDADLVIWTGDPLDGRSSASMVIIDGEIVRDELEKSE